jgi:hypothetical protein
MHDPYTPAPRLNSRWQARHKNLVEVAKNATNELDVVFLGDSIFERWSGTRNMGGKVLEEERAIFQRRFSKQQNASIEGLALATSEDKVSTSKNVTPLCCRHLASVELTSI